MNIVLDFYTIRYFSTNTSLCYYLFPHEFYQIFEKQVGNDKVLF